MSSTTYIDLNHLKAYTLSLWENPRLSSIHSSMKTYSYWEKIQNEKYLEHCLDIFFDLIESVPFETLQTSEFRKVISSELTNLVASAPFLGEGEKKYMTDKHMISATLDFVDRFYSEDSECAIEDLGQALRNFWIGNLLQSSFQKVPAATTPLYNYSMLYPYTDNLLDDLTLSTSDKKTFCHQLTQVLMGEPLTSNQMPESRIFELVKGIYMDSSYTSSDLLKVRESLLAIHQAQINSIHQQCTDLMPYEMDLLGQTFFKGGTSLLADGFIVHPEMSNQQMAFCYAFGAALQLCDDLQDLESDCLSGHYTLFSQLKGHFILDPLLVRLEGFLEALKVDFESWLPEESHYLSTVIIQNTKLLLYAAVLQHESYFKRSFVAKIETYLPVRPKFMKKMNKKFKSRFRKSALSKSYKMSV